MRILLQRVTSASVRIGGETIASVDSGLLVLICAMRGDTAETAERMASRISRLRIFRDERGKMNLSVKDTGGQILVVSQFTLAADMRSGNRPGFSYAAPPELGEQLYLHFADTLRSAGLSVSTGIFGADMQVSLENDGPVTIWMDSAERS